MRRKNPSHFSLFASYQNLSFGFVLGQGLTMVLVRVKMAQMQRGVYVFVGLVFSILRPLVKFQLVEMSTYFTTVGDGVLALKSAKCDSQKALKRIRKNILSFVVYIQFLFSKDLLNLFLSNKNPLAKRVDFCLLYKFNIIDF